MVKKALSICALGAILAGAAMAQVPIPSSEKGTAKSLAPAPIPVVTSPKGAKAPMPAKVDCCPSSAKAAKGSSKQHGPIYKVYVANTGYTFYSSAKLASAGRKQYAIKGFKVGPVQKAASWTSKPAATKA
jgi:hypothetical protein